MDAEMLYHKDAVFWLANFKRAHSPAPYPLGAFSIKSLFLGRFFSNIRLRYTFSVFLS